MPASKKLQFVCRVLNKTHGADFVSDLLNGVTLSEMKEHQEDAIKTILLDDHSINVDAVDVPTERQQIAALADDFYAKNEPLKPAADLLAAGRLGYNKQDALRRMGLAYAKRKDATA